MLPFNPFGAMLPFNPFGAMLPFNPFGAMLPFNPFGAMLPFNPFGAMLPFNPFGAMLPFNPFGAMLPFNPFGAILPFNHFGAMLPFNPLLCRCGGCGWICHLHCPHPLPDPACGHPPPGGHAHLDGHSLPLRPHHTQSAGGKGQCWDTSLPGRDQNAARNLAFVNTTSFLCGEGQKWALVAQRPREIYTQSLSVHGSAVYSLCCRVHDQPGPL